MQSLAHSQLRRLSTISLPRSSLPSSSHHASTAASLSSTPAGPSRRRRRSEPENLDGVDLIGPPDTASNIRPIIYAHPKPHRQSPNSPYSTAEFPAAETRLYDLELEWRMRRERVDAMNHRFWAATNAEFNAQLAYRLDRLPPASDPPTQEDTQRREACLDQFYADWQAANRVRMSGWVWEWWGEVWAGLRMQGRIYVARVLGR